MLADICKKMENEPNISNTVLFKDFDLLYGHPWEDNLTSEITNYYSCLFNIVKKEQPKRILEIGTALE